MGKSKKVTVGYRYYVGMHMVLCHGPVDAVTAIEVDGRQAWTGTSTGGSVTINAPDLFGGESREGGVSGVVDIMMGGTTQTRNSYLQSKLGTDIPAFRGVLSAVLRQVLVGQNPYLKSWAFWATRRNTRLDGQPQWYSSKVAVGDDMNAAHIVRECLTDPSWGMGYPEADIDDAAFSAAADTLYTEGLGLSLLWDRSMPLNEFLSEVLKHIDASLYVSRSTGKFVLKLIRGGYNVATLLELNESNVSKLTDFKRNTIGELINSVTVQYWDGSTGKDNSVTVQDISLVAQQGATVGTTLQFPGITTGTNATKVAARSLKALSTPLASCTIYTNRVAYSLNVGDVFKLNWPRFGVATLVMRVTNIEFGAVDNNEIRITAVEDVFGTAAAIYAAPPPSAWTNPVSVPAPCPYHVTIEAPYWELVPRLGEAAAQALPATTAYVVATGVRPSGDAVSAKMYTDPGNTNTWQEANTVDFCPTAVLATTTTFNDTVWAINSGIDLALVSTGTYALIDNEFVAVTAISDSSITVLRGVLDTVPAIHTSGARLFFIEDTCETDGVEYATGETARIRLLPTTGRGTLAINSATTQSRTLSGRQARPYPPQRIRINSLAYPSSVPGDANISVSWAHRNRLQQTVSLVGTETASIGPEAGTTYTAQLLLASGAMVTAQSGITGLTHSFTTAVMGANYGAFRLQVWATRSTLDSYQIHDIPFLRAGYGTTYGNSYGGA